MQDVKITVASVRSTLLEPGENLTRVDKACAKARRDGARMIVLPELMLTGHGGHPKMIAAAEPIPGGPLSRAILEMSATYSLCICVGIAELADRIVFNSQMVADKGVYLGLQRKINLSGDEYCYFGAGESLEVFDIGDIRYRYVDKRATQDQPCPNSESSPCHRSPYAPKMRQDIAKPVNTYDAHIMCDS